MRRPIVQRFSLPALVLTLAVVLGPTVTAQELRVLTAPQLLLPLADRDVWGLGYGGSLAVSTELADYLAPWAGLRVQSIQPAARGLESSLLLASLAGGVEGFMHPTARLRLAASAGGGAYAGSYRNGAERVPTGNLFWQIGAEAGYRLSPGVTLSGGATYLDLRRETDSLYRGLSISVVASLGVQLGPVEGRVVLDRARSNPVFPVFADDYDATPFGTLTIRNGESAEIRNVEVRFRVPGYTSSSILCGTIDLLARGEEATVPLLANFSEAILGITELLRTAGEIQIDYELLGESRSSVAETTIAIRNRNAMVWSDPRALAVFVSANDRALVDLSKYVAGIVRSETRMEIDSNLQYALALFEGIRLTGLAWGADPQTPYARMRTTPDEEDYVQYPHQTIAYQSGDADDLAVLYAAAAESVGVPTALIPLDDDVVVAVKLGMPESSARSFFADPDDLLFADGDPWIPVLPSMLREGFLRAWSEAARLLRETPGSSDRFFRTADAWVDYPAAGIPGIEVTGRRPPEDQLVRAFTNLVGLVVEREIAPKVDRIRGAFGPEGGSGRQHNTLGILYARYGMYEEALASFETALELGYDRAVINIGNVAFLISNYEAALEWYRRATEQNPADATAVIGLARTYYELDLYEETDRYFEEATSIMPELAETYGYLSARIGETAGRASAAADRFATMLWDE